MRRRGRLDGGAAACLATLLLTTPAAAVASPRAPGIGELTAATTRSAQHVGDAVVAGIVIETDGTPVPGANVVLEGPRPGNRQRRAPAGRDGRFRFDRVAPGAYVLRVELPGLSAPGDVELTVAAGQQLATTLVLSLFAYSVNVQVGAAEGRTEDVFGDDSAADRRTLSNRALTRLPLPAEDALEALPVLPGVVRGPRGLISVGGSLPEDSAYLFNGADLQDVFNGRYRFRVPLDAIESVDLQAGVFSAATPDRLGGVIDVTTAGGTDTWDFSIASFLPRPWFRGGLAGVRRFTPRVRFAGPLVPGRAFVSQSLEYRFERERVRDVPGDSGDHERIEGWEWLTQLDLALGRDHQLRVAGFLFPESRRNLGLDGLTPLESTRTERNRSAAGLVRHQWRLDDRSFLDTTAQVSRVSVQSRPTVIAGGDPFVVSPDQVAGAAFHSRDRVAMHWQLRTVYRRAFGVDTSRQVLQVGLELHRLSVDGRHQSAPVRVTDAAGRLLRRIDFAGSTRLDGGKNEWAVFAQHRTRPADRFWIDVGVRLFRDGAAARPSFGPRLGAAWDVRGDGRTLLKAGVGILHRRIYLGEMLWEQNATRLETDDDGIVTRVVPARAAELETPRATLTTAELSHRFSDRLTARARGALRESSHRLVFDRVGDSLLLANTGAATARELELTINYRPGDDTQLFVSYVRSSAAGDLNDFTAVASTDPAPVLRPNAYAPLPFAAPNRLLVWGVVSLPAGLQVAPVIEWRDGFPYSRLRADQGYEGAPATERFPSYLSADINLTKAVRLFGRGFRAGLQVRNVTGHFNPRDVIASSGSDRAGRFLNDHGRRFRIRFSTRF